MKHILTLCCLALGGLVASAAEVSPGVSVDQLTRHIQRQVASIKKDDYPTLQQVQEIAKHHHGDLDALTKQLIPQEQYGAVQSIWYDGAGTFVVVSLDEAQSIRAEFYGPGVVRYLPNYCITGLRSYGTDGVHPATRGQFFIGPLELPAKSDGMDEKDVLSVVASKMPKEMTLIASAKFHRYELRKVLDIVENSPAEPLWFLASSLVDGYHMVRPVYDVHSIWYKDGALLVVTFTDGTHCHGEFYGARRGRIDVEVSPSIYPSEGDRMMEVVGSMIPKKMTLVSLAGD